MATAKEKKEEVKKHLQNMRAELRTIHLAVTDELKLPEANSIKDLMAEMDTGSLFLLVLKILHLVIILQVKVMLDYHLQIFL